MKTQCTARCLQRVAQRKGDNNNRCEMGIRIGVFPLSHTLRATCGTLPCLAMRINSLLTRCEQRAVLYLAMRTNSLLTSQSLGEQRAVYYIIYARKDSFLSIFSNKLPQCSKLSKMV